MKFLIKFICDFIVYLKYLMSIGFKELLVNVILLICIVLISTLVYVPIGILADLIRSILVTFSKFEGIVVDLLYLFSSIASAICAVWLFLYLFQLRFHNISALKEQITNDLTKKEKTKNSAKEENKKGIEEDIVLPKVKKD